MEHWVGGACLSYIIRATETMQSSMRASVTRKTCALDQQIESITVSEPSTTKAARTSGAPCHTVVASTPQSSLPSHS